MRSSHQTANTLYALLPPREQWRQTLIFPAVDIREDGVSLYRNISNYILWIELPSHKIWGLTFWTFTPFISFRVLERIAQRLETAHPRELDAILTHLATLAGWRKIERSTQSDINMIAEDLARAEIRATLENSMSVKLADENVRQAACPFKAAFVEGLLTFNDTLDQDVLALLGNEPMLSCGDAVAYNYLMHPITKIECYRRQAMQTFPLLRNAFYYVTEEFRYQRLQRNVDSGNPLLPVLSDFFRCPLPVVRFLVGKDFDLVGEEWRSQLDQLVDLLGMLKPGYWPKAAEDWEHFSRWIMPVFSALGDCRNREYPEMLANCLNDLAKEGYARIPARLEKHGVALIDITTIPDFDKSLCEWSAEVDTVQSAASEALWQYSVLKIAVLSHRWHDWLVRRMEEQETAVDESEVASSGWPTFISKPWHNDRHTVVPLNYPWALHEEGRCMKHCVGTYVSPCRYFGSHIFSLRGSATGQPLSTVELQIDERSGSKNEIVVVQHRAHGNATPTTACEQTLQEFLRYLGATVTREQFNDIHKQQQKRCSESEEYRKLVFRPAWPRRMVDEFRGLLHGYPLLEQIGQGEKHPILSKDEMDALLECVFVGE